MPSARSQKMLQDIIACRAEAVTLDVAIPKPTTGVIALTSGTANVQFRCDAAAVDVEMIAGVEYRWDVIQINTAGTTATGILLLRP